MCSIDTPFSDTSLFENDYHSHIIGWVCDLASVSTTPWWRTWNMGNLEDSCSFLGLFFLVYWWSQIWRLFISSNPSLSRHRQLQTFVYRKELRTEIWLQIVHYKQFVLKPIHLASTQFTHGNWASSVVKQCVQTKSVTKNLVLREFATWRITLFKCE